MSGTILATDATCGKTYKVCGVNASCDIITHSVNFTLPTYTGWSAIGNMESYPLDEL
ncbi:hypothetical protein SPRG_15451, partial [Saprolegnia parasitica CBS 223.65]